MEKRGFGAATNSLIGESKLAKKRGEVLTKQQKTTKLMIDGKALYIHRANFQIINKELI